MPVKFHGRRFVPDGIFFSFDCPWCIRIDGDDDNGFTRIFANDVIPLSASEARGFSWIHGNPCFETRDDTRIMVH